MKYDGLHKGTYYKRSDIFSECENIETGDSNDGPFEAPAGNIYTITYKWTKFAGQEEGHYEFTDPVYEPIDKISKRVKEENIQPIVPAKPAINISVGDKSQLNLPTVTVHKRMLHR